MKLKKKLSLLFVATMFSIAIASCGGASTPTAGDKTSTDTSTTKEATTETATETTEASGIDLSQKEAPMLAEQVSAGKLGKLEERLPITSDIMVEPDVMELGEYGGSMVSTVADNGHWTFGQWGEQSMFRFKQDGSGEVEPNVAKEFSANEDSTVWTIKLREGMRWSDGAPFTADDVIFYYDHMSTPALNDDRTAIGSDEEGYLTPYTSKPYGCYQVTKDGKDYWAEFTKVNDYEFTVTFAAPKPSFAESVAVDNKWMFLPKHFYINYVARKDGVTDDPTFPLITDEQALANANKDFGKQWDSYSTMGKDIGYYHWDYAIVPQVRAFIATKDNWNEVGQTYELVRNPYFWKTDSEGRQLPYLDSIQFKIINDQSQIALAASSGVIDEFVPESNFSTIATETKDTHKIVDWVTTDWSALPLSLNQTVKDLDKRALFQDIRFREALSICVDRELLNETLKNGVSSPSQASVQEGIIGYDEEWFNKWIEQDVDKANKLLDEITEPWDGTPNTYRKMKGTDKDVEIILTTDNPSLHGDRISLLQSAYKAVGVKFSDKVDADWRKALLTNDVEASFEGIALSTPAIRPDAIVPIRNITVWYSGYGKWYEDGKTDKNGGIEPTGDVMELIVAYDKIKAANGPDRDNVIAENVQKIYDLHKKNIWIIGYLTPEPIHALVSNRVRNYPEGLIRVDEFRGINFARPEQFWVQE